MKKVLFILLAIPMFLSCSTENEKSILSKKSFQEKMLEYPFLEETKVKIISNGVETRNNREETSVSFLNENDKELLSIEITEQEGNMYVVRDSESKEILLYLHIEKDGDSYITHTYDKNMSLRNDNECFVSETGNEYLIIPTKIYESDSSTRGWFGSGATETVNECYTRHMSSTLGRFISVSYSRIMGAAGIASAHTAGYLSCYVYRL